jgi:glycosyltransferase involved in cell wall biosynthesis
MKPARAVALILGPSREAISGVTTHVNLLLESRLAEEYVLAHFQIGSEGRTEGVLGTLARLAASPFKLALAILERDAAIVHLNTSFTLRAYWRDLVYLAVAKLSGARVVYQVHGGPLPQAFFPKPFGALLRATLRWPDAVLVLASKELEAYRAFGVNAAVLANGIDCTPYQRYNRCPDAAAPLRLIYIGRLAREKGLYETLESLDAVRRRGFATRFLIAGSGPEEPWLRARVRELRLSKDVSFIGTVDNGHKARLLSQADVLMLPSYAEGLPYALLEGMAAGAVPIATPVGAIADVVKDGVHGVLVPARDPRAIADALARLSADRARLARMSAACRKRIATAYSIERVATELAGVYAAVLAARAPRTVL